MRTNLTSLFTDIADAIRSKKGTSAQISPQDFASEIASIEGGGGSSSGISVGDVTYYDYNGTVLHSYTADAFAALAKHPALPECESLVCQGWNYDLANTQEYVAKYGKTDIGANYITNDGKTRLYIRIAAEGRMDVYLYFSQTVANGVTIDWGDGSDTQTLSGTGNKNTTHKYTSIGDYCITLSVVNKCTLGLGHNSTGFCVMDMATNNRIVYCNMLQRIEIGSSVTSIGSYAFQNCRSISSIVIPKSATSIGSSTFKNCYSLSSIVIPESATSIGSYAFSDCHSISSIVIPKGVTSIGSYAFNNCYSLSSIVIPEGIKSIGSSTFNNCYSLASVTIPEGVTSIGTYAFSNCYGMAFYDFSTLTSVPSLSATSAFSGIPSDCKIVVPDALYDEWIAATNWVSYASNIVKVSEFNS